MYMKYEYSDVMVIKMSYIDERDDFFYFITDSN